MYQLPGIFWSPGCSRADAFCGSIKDATSMSIALGAARRVVHEPGVRHVIVWSPWGGTFEMFTDGDGYRMERIDRARLATEEYR